MSKSGSPSGAGHSLERQDSSGVMDSLECLPDEIVVLINQNGVTSLYVQNVDSDLTQQPEAYQAQVRFSSEWLSVGDFDGDERDEVAVIEKTIGLFGEERVAVHQLTPSAETSELVFNRAFSADSGHTRIIDIAVGDLNADGLDEIVLVDEGDFLVFYDVDLDDIQSPLQRRHDARMILSDDPKRIALADFDGDSPKATLSGPPTTVPGAEVPVVVLTLPPYYPEYSGGSSSSGYGSGDFTSESFTDTLSLGLSADVGVKASFLGLFEANYSVKTSRRASQTLGEGRVISTGIRTSISSQPSLFGDQ